MQKKLTCYRCKKKFDGDPARGNLCEECLRIGGMRPTHYWFGISMQNTLPSADVS